MVDLTKLSIEELEKEYKTIQASWDEFGQSDEELVCESLIKELLTRLKTQDTLLKEAYFLV